jgi:MoaA/NifB/PqqE/SkfB family radical SAM enzyme
MHKNLPLVDITNRTNAGRPVPKRGAPAPRSIQRQQLTEQNAYSSGIPIEQDPFNIIILNYTMKCPLACDYCCYSCGPLRTETMPIELALSVIEQAAALEVFHEAGFTGGDPMVLFDDMVILAQKMSDVGLPFSMISACDWATDNSITRKKLSTLANLGMNVFTISQDASHEKFVSLDHIKRAADQCLDLGVRLVLCGSNYEDTVRLEEKLPDYVGDARVSFVNRIVLPGVGRSKGKKISKDMFPNVDPIGTNSCYKRTYHDVTVFWDGEVYPCCSVYNRETPGISYGNLYDSPLEEVWDRIEGSLMLQTIKHGTFDELYRFVGRLDPDLAAELPDPSSALGPCHLCNLIFGKSDLARRVKSLFEEEEDRRIHDILHLVADKYGSGVAESVARSVLLDS